MLLTAGALVSASYVTRSFSNQTPATCSVLNVFLNISVNGGDTFYVIDEVFPAGWSLVNTGVGNTSTSGHIKWTVITGAASTQYQYSVATPCSSIGKYSFSGEYVFNNLSVVNIGGLNNVSVVDIEAPIITLLGNNVVNISVGSSYADKGATALDNVGGNLTSSIVTTGSVNTNTVGKYIIRYNVRDGSGNSATEVTRTVNVNPITCITTADTNLDYKIEMSELLVHIGKWNTGQITIEETANAINLWDIGFGC
jgi:hypothetical protein